MRRILRTSHDHRRRASLKADEENLINVSGRKLSDSGIPNTNGIEDQRRKSLPANVFISGTHTNRPKSAAFSARKRLRRFMTIKDEAFEMKYKVTASIICASILLIIIVSLYQLLFD